MKRYLDEFDFSFCANCYGNGKLLITSPEAVKNKTSHVYLKVKYGRYLTNVGTHKVMENGRNRIFKYRNKGYIIVVLQKEITEIYPYIWNNFWKDV